MPNWCHNTLTVKSDDPADLARFVEAVKEHVDDDTLRKEYDSTFFIGDEKPTFADWVVTRRESRQPLSFETLVPCGTGDDWYESHLTKWGTKWDANFDGAVVALGGPEMDVDLTTKANGAVETPTVVVYKFDTAWSPPLPFVQSASELYPEIEFTLRWAEVGNEAAAQHRFVAGLEVEQEDLAVEDVLAPEEMWF